jgi:periplasmic protein CpxP/Spy
MTATVKRAVLGLGAAVIAMGVTAGVYASAGNTSQDPPAFNAQGPGGGQGRFGGPGGRGGPGGPMGMLPRLGPQIGLTDAQKQQIKAIADSSKSDWKALADKARAAHQALNAAVSADTFDETLVRSKSADVSVVDADLSVARAHAFGEVWQILTADQRTKVRQMEAAMQQHMQGRQHARRERAAELLQRLGL